VTLAEELRIGTLEGPPETSFGKVTAVTPLGDGVFVVDQYSTALRHFDWDGNYLGDVGSTGAGPGEFYEILGLKRHPEGVALWDPRNGRISIYSENGEFLRSIRYSSGLFTADPFQVDTAGCFYLRALAPDAVLQRGLAAKEVWVKLAADGSVLDSIPIPLRSHQPGFVSYTSTGPRKPFLIEHLSSLSPFGYQVDGTNTAYELYRPLPDGRTLAIARSYTPVPIAAAERDEWDRILDYIATRSSTSLVPRIPGHNKPPFREIRIDQDGRIWVSLYVEAEFTPQEPRTDGPPTMHWREPPVWDVLDPRGQYLGTVSTPNGWVAAAHGRHVWVVESGELGENYVVRYRIQTADSR
jgi:hypothetical protein